MSFKNKKQEVLEIQLTRLGKEQYIQGKFNPKYYAFSDHDIIYDIAYTDHMEHPHNADGRITTGTQRQDVLPHRRSVEETSRQIIEQQKLNAILGTSAIDNQKYPAYRVRFVEGEITGTVYHKTGSYISDRIPQIHSEATVTYDLENQKIVVDPQIILDIQELNGIFQKENFDISVEIIDYITSSNGNVITSSVPLGFFDNSIISQVTRPLVVNDVPIQETILQNVPIITKNNVEYYLLIEVDDEINSDITFDNGQENIYQQYDYSDDEIEC